MEKTIELIKSFFKTTDWKYKFSSKRSMFTVGINMGNVLGNLDIYINLRKNAYTVIACLNNHAEEKYFQQISEYLHRVNFGLNNGNFEMDYDDGEIRYKTYVSVENIELSNDIVEESILIPIFMFEKYGKNLLKLMIQEDDPKALAIDAEIIDEKL